MMSRSTTCGGRCCARPGPCELSTPFCKILRPCLRGDWADTESELDIQLQGQRLVGAKELMGRLKLGGGDPNPKPILGQNNPKLGRKAKGSLRGSFSVLAYPNDLVSWQHLVCPCLWRGKNSIMTGSLQNRI